VFCRLVVLFGLSVPVQMIDWKDSSLRLHYQYNTNNTISMILHEEVWWLLCKTREDKKWPIMCWWGPGR